MTVLQAFILIIGLAFFIILSVMFVNHEHKSEYVPQPIDTNKVPILTLLGWNKERYAFIMHLRDKFHILCDSLTHSDTTNVIAKEGMHRFFHTSLIGKLIQYSIGRSFLEPSSDLYKGLSIALAHHTHEDYLDAVKNLPKTLRDLDNELEIYRKHILMEKSKCKRNS